jgi:hypothetical protein
MPKDAKLPNNQTQFDQAEFIRQARARIKSILLKNLDVSPSFRRICRQALGFNPANSNQSKNLAKNHFTFRGPEMPSTKPNKPSAQQPKGFKNVTTCQHIKVTGVPCGGPPMRGEQFCYFHQRMLRGVKTPPNARLHSIALIEDEESIQASLMEVINALARNHIDLPRAALIIRALNIAVRNSRRAKFNVNNSTMVREIPDYPAPPKSAAPPARAIVEEDQEIKERAAKNALAQLQARALATLPTPSIDNEETGEVKKKNSGETANAGAPPLHSVQGSRPEPAEGWDPAIRYGESASPRPSMKAGQRPLATKVTPLDSAHRKPPARAGSPATAKIAVNQQRTRT